MARNRLLKYKLHNIILHCSPQLNYTRYFLNTQNLGKRD